LTRRIIARWGEPLDLWQLPTLSISLAREHEWAAGTMSLSIQGMTALMRDLGREIARALPARNLAVINGHGGNRGILEALAQDLRADFGLNVCVLHPAVWAELDANAAIPEIHGGKNETSMMLAIAPQLVRRDQIAQLKNTPDGKTIRQTVLDPAVSWPWTTNDKRIADIGVIGDAQAASAEFGERIIDHVIETAGAVLKRLLDNQRLASR
jgi:creatinine amidohydrolase